MIEWNDLIVGNLYYYKTSRSIWFCGPKNKILLLNKKLELLSKEEPFIMLTVLREACESNSFKCKILSAKGIIGLIYVNPYYIAKYNGGNNE